MKEKQYRNLASVYDSLNSQYDYNSYARFIDGIIRENQRIASSLVLDLGCGTGNITIPLQKMGYDMTGVDISEDMLSVARKKCENENIQGILWLCQDMREFELYGTVDVCVSTLDSINYITKESDLIKVFDLVHNYLAPDGLFIFDVNTPYRFDNVYADKDYILETDNTLCAWRNDYNKKSKICTFYLSVFENSSDGLYRRFDEIQKEKCYSQKQIVKCLKTSGFELIKIYGNFDFESSDDSSEKWYFVARAIK